MATLVLGAVGTAVGGPAGGAIGTLMGNMLDQSIFRAGSGGRRSSDLEVQSSAYGTDIPKVFGTMRVAGSIIWATDLVEGTSSTVSKGGVSGPTYSASFAVALSSRPVIALKRIWADGKLLRGAAGDFKVGCTFRFYAASEEQLADPLIASAEGAALTPAHRGMTVAVFENLELSSFGNRIPNLTFEVDCDDALDVADILIEASQNLISSDAIQPITGFAVQLDSIQTAIAPLLDVAGVVLRETTTGLQRPQGGQVSEIPENCLGCAPGEKAQKRRHWMVAAASDLPAQIALSYFDPKRDYLAGTQSAHAMADDRSIKRIDLPAVLDASVAKSLAEAYLANRWSEREQLTIFLPPSFAFLLPGDLVRITGDGATWRINEASLEDFVVALHLKRYRNAGPNLSADSGRVAEQVDRPASPTIIVVAEPPSYSWFASAAPRLLVATSSQDSSHGGRVPLSVEAGGQVQASLASRGRAVAGVSATSLPVSAPVLMDTRSTVDVQMVSVDDWLLNVDDVDLIAGANLAMLGDELMQFGRAEPIGLGRFRLSRLLRGVGGTEFAVSSHSIGENFVLLSQEAVSSIEVPAQCVGSSISIVAHGLADLSPNNTRSIIARGEALRPPCPVHLSGIINDDGNLEISWVRRSRLGWTWPDEIDVPLGERQEAYRVRVVGATSATELMAPSNSCLVAEDTLIGLGGGPFTVVVNQIGDQAISRDASLVIN